MPTVHELQDEQRALRARIDRLSARWKAAIAFESAIALGRSAEEVEKRRREYEAAAVVEPSVLPPPVTSAELIALADLERAVDGGSWLFQSARKPATATLCRAFRRLAGL